MPCLRSAEVIMATLRARHHRLQHVLRGVDASGDRQVGPDVTVEDRDPVQPHEQLVRARQGQARHDLELLEVEVRQVEAVEEHQPVGARRRPSARARLASAVKAWPSLTATGIDTLAFTSRTRSTYICSTSAPVMAGSVGT